MHGWSGWYAGVGCAPCGGSQRSCGQVITPPTVGWEEYMKEAFESGALEAITAVLKKHRGDPDVLAASTACLSSLATNPQYAGKLVESGAMLSMVDSVTENPGGEEGVKETMLLLEVVAQHNPEALVAAGGMKNLVRLLSAAGEHKEIMGQVARTLERMNRISGGPASLMESDGIPALLKSLLIDFGLEDTQHLQPCFRIIERLCRNPANAEAIRKADGIKQLCVALNVHKDKELACKIGSRALTKLAAGNVKELIGQLEGTTDPAEREFLAQLLANLALEEDNAEKIVKCGGVPTLVETFKSPSQKTIEASSRALARIASVPENVPDVVKSGAIEVLVATLDQYEDNDAIISSCVPTLLKLATTEEDVERIVAAGGLASVLRTLVKHPEFEEATVEGLKFLENLGAIGFDMGAVVEGNGITALITAMKRYPENAEVQLQGTRGLIYMADTVHNVAAMTAAGIVDVLNQNLLFAADNKLKDLAVAGMYLTASVALVDANRTAMASGGCVDTVLSAIAAFGKDEAVREGARDVVETIVEEASVTKVVAEIESRLRECALHKSPEAAQALIKAVGKAGAFSIVPDNAEILVRSNGVQAVVAALEKIAQAKKVPMQEEILRACSRTLMEVSDSVAQDDELRTLLGESGAVKAVITTIKTHPKFTDNVRAGVHFLESYAQIPSCATIIINEGGINACVTAMRANQTDLQVCQDAVNTMLQLAGTDEGAVAVAKQGGTRQVINTVEANINTPNFSKPMEAMLRLLQRVALTAEGAEVLVKQGGVEAVIDAADALSDSARVAQASSRVLARLLTRDDVILASDRLKEVQAQVASGTMPTLEELKPVVSRVGHMALVGSNADVIQGEGGVDCIATILQAVLAQEDEAVKRQLLPVAIQALSNLAKGTTIDPALGFVAMLDQGITSGAAVSESVDALQSLAKNPANAKTMLDTGVLNTIIDTLKANTRDHELARNCFSALADAAKHSEVATALASTAAARLAQDWIDDNVDEADADTMQSALNLLAALSSSETVCVQLMESGVVDLVKGVLTKCCIDKANRAILGSAVELAAALSRNEAVLTQMASQGGLKRVMRAVRSKPQYMESATVMGATLGMINQAATSSDTAREALASQGADQLIVEAMNKNGTDTGLLTSGARAMAVLGMGAEAASSALQEVQSLAAALESADTITGDQAAELGAAVQKLSNLMMVEGIVSRENGEQIMTVLSDSLARLVECEDAPQDSLAAGVQSIGRLASLEVMEPVSLAGAVEMVMDVMQLNEDSDVIRESAIHCLGSMAQGTAVIKVMSEQGCLAIISEAAKAAPADEQLQSVVANTITKITEVAEASARELVAEGEAGADALASVIQANAQDEHMLASCVQAIVTSEGGEDALWQVLDSEEGSAEAQAEMIRVLRVRSDASGGGAGEVQAIGATPKRVAGLMRSMGAALTRTQDTKTDVESRTTQKALRTVENTLSLLADMKLDPESATALASSGGVQHLLTMLEEDIEEPDAAGRLLAILSDATSLSSTAAASVAANKQHVVTVVESVKVHMEDPVLTAQCLQTLASVVTATGATGSHLDRDALRTVQAAIDMHPGDAAITAAGNTIVAKLSEVYSDEPAQRMMESLDTAQVVITQAGQVQSLKDDAGRTYVAVAVAVAVAGGCGCALLLVRGLTALRVAAVAQLLRGPIHRRDDVGGPDSGGCPATHHGCHGGSRQEARGGQRAGRGGGGLGSGGVGAGEQRGRRQHRHVRRGDAERAEQQRGQLRRHC